MGPRSCERGNAAQHRFHQRHREMLQWGRARASAEMCVSVRESRILRRLQWGRARASAEIGLGAGPGELEPGVRFNGAALVRARKSFRLRYRLGHPGRFNGAALVRARKCKQAGILPAPREGFNGAALVRARKYEAVAETPRYLRGFNGAALVRARKYPCH